MTKSEAIEAIVYIFTNGLQWYLNIDNQNTGHQIELPITEKQKQTLVNEGVPIL